MRKYIAVVALGLMLTTMGCRGLYDTAWKPTKWVYGKVLNMYTGNGHFDGKARWDNFTKSLQKIQNFADIHFFNYDIRDPYVGTPFFGDPR